MASSLLRILLHIMMYVYPQRGGLYKSRLIGICCAELKACKKETIGFHSSFLNISPGPGRLTFTRFFDDAYFVARRDSRDPGPRPGSFEQLARAAPDQTFPSD